MAATILRQHDCESEYQDKKYGKKIRLCNVGKTGKAVCTVCGKDA